MHVNIKTGLLNLYHDENISSNVASSLQFLPSPNYDERPNQTTIDLIIIHYISLPPGKFGTSDVPDFFMNRLEIGKHPFFDTIKNAKVSSHLFIRRNGEIIQFVPFHKRAWHAGESTFENRQACNNFSIGIELEGDEHQPFTQQQYSKLVNCTKAIMQAYPAITPEKIVGHSDVAPGRKQDPGPFFDWTAYRGALTMV